MKAFISILLLLLCGACATPRRAAPTMPQPVLAPAEIPARSEAMNDLAFYAMSLAGTPYRYGGDSPEQGFDCSGFVRYVFRHALNLPLPRTTEEMSRMGQPVGQDDLRPGDLVFYDTLRQAFSHVGIYLGDHRFVHAPSNGKAVEVVNMGADYWQHRYNGARRIALQR
jgi:cell wall-associated NlpC family hydrolase